MDDDAIDVIASRTPEGIGFSFKVRGTGRLYRVEPVRDPDQPRYWRFRIFRCLPGGRADPAERPWLGGPGLGRDGLAEAASTIREDVAGWLGQQDHGELKRWVFAAPAAVAATPRSAPAKGSAALASVNAGDGATVGGGSSPT